MPSPLFHRASKPFHDPLPFVTGAAQEEAFARLDYLRGRGSAMAEVSGPAGIGKSSLLSELARRGRARGEFAHQIMLSADSGAEFLQQIADAWCLDVSTAEMVSALRRRIVDHLQGVATFQRAGWLLIDTLGEVPPEVLREIRWLMASAERHHSQLICVLAQRSGASEATSEANLHFALWPWETMDCDQYLAACCRQARMDRCFAHDAVAALVERSGGLPGLIAKLAEWVWLASEAEDESQITAELVHAVADELLPSAPRPATYEMSAAYGAW